MSIESKLKNHHERMFAQYGIDAKTGLLGDSLRFATFPYIGSRYGQSSKILFVGLDIGRDKGPVLSFAKRNESIEKKQIGEHNLHIAGTYVTALYFLQGEMKWEKEWSHAKLANSCQRVLKSGSNLPDTNPLSYVSLTNYFKFVTVDRENRSGDQDRKNLNKDFDDEFFVDEVEIFDPDTVIFQSLKFNSPSYKKVMGTLLRKGRAVYIGPHPAWHNKKQPDFFVNKIQRWSGD